MTTLSAAIKKELKQTFPGIKFSVTTQNGDVSVKWELPLGTDATVAAVKDICNKHKTVVHHGDLMNDTAWSSGSSVYTNPEYTQERKDWALEQTKARNFARVIWNEKHQRFEDADGADAYHATKQYREYLENGVSSALVTEYGSEPWAKHWYYETLKKEQAQAESAPIEAETTEVRTPEPIAPATPETNLIFFPSPKQPEPQAEAQVEQPQPEVKFELLAIDSFVTTNRCRIKVTDIRSETVTGQLLDDQNNLVIEYGHPIYVCVRKLEILFVSEQTQPKPENITSATSKTSPIPFPSPKQPKSQAVAQSKSDDGDDF